MTTTLGIFAKYWQPGAVKTRLAASIGNEAAAALHRCFVQTLLGPFAGIADRHILCITPPSAIEQFRALDLGCWTLEPQTSGDLGARMQHFFLTFLPPLPRGEGRGPARTILIGSDSPDLPRDYLEEAFDKLRDYPVVLGPSDDGGYYLVGLARDVPPIFENIPWSTPAVWPQTLARLDAAQIPYHILPQWYDVDDLSDLQRLYKSLLPINPLHLQISALTSNL